MPTGRGNLDVAWLIAAALDSDLCAFYCTPSPRMFRPRPGRVSDVHLGGESELCVVRQGSFGIRLQLLPCVFEDHPLRRSG